MPDPTRPGDLPPDLPEEYAQAYERGYRRALLGDPGTEPTARFGRLDAPSEDLAPAHRGRRRRESKAWLVPVLLAVMVLGLVAAAYLLGRMFSAEVSSTRVSEGPPDGVALSDDDATPQDTASRNDEASDEGKDKKRRQPYLGPVQRVQVVSVGASCQYPSSVDAAGNPVSYPPEQVQDGDLSTAWRCAGEGIGERLTLTLPGPVPIAEVGLVPGYAKTDPRTGTDRYAENNRITEVRWILGDGREFVQRLDGSPENRNLQTMRIPATRTDTVVVEVVASTGGPRNTIAISEMTLGSSAR